MLPDLHDHLIPVSLPTEKLWNLHIPTSLSPCPCRFESSHKIVADQAMLHWLQQHAPRLAWSSHPRFSTYRKIMKPPHPFIPLSMFVPVWIKPQNSSPRTCTIAESETLNHPYPTSITHHPLHRNKEYRVHPWHCQLLLSLRQTLEVCPFDGMGVQLVHMVMKHVRFSYIDKTFISTQNPKSSQVSQ